MLSNLSWHQFREWMAYSQIDPFDEWRQDLRTAQIIYYMVNLMRSDKVEPIPIEKFILKFGKAFEEMKTERIKPKQTWQQQKMIAYQIATSHGWKRKK